MVPLRSWDRHGTGLAAPGRGQALYGRGRRSQRTKDLSEADWVSITEPRTEDVTLLRGLGISSGLLAHIQDPNERPRVERKTASC